MKPFIQIFFILLLCISCKENRSSEVISLKPEAFQQKMKEMPDASVIDVRTPEEFALGHLSNSKLINFKDPDFKNQVASLDKTKPVFLYCAAGVRSAKAAEVFQNVGFNEIYLMEEGFKEWEKQNLPFVK